MPETPTTTTLAPSVFPPGRYGRRRAPRRASRLVTAALAVVLALVGGFIALRLFTAYGDGDYSASVTGFTDVSDTQIVISFTVRMPAEGQARCVLRARNASGIEVGRAEVIVQSGPDPARTQVTKTLATSARPVTGEIQGCLPA